MNLVAEASCLCSNSFSFIRRRWSSFLVLPARGSVASSGEFGSSDPQVLVLLLGYTYPYIRGPLALLSTYPADPAEGFELDILRA